MDNITIPFLNDDTKVEVENYLSMLEIVKTMSLSKNIVTSFIYFWGEFKSLKEKNPSDYLKASFILKCFINNDFNNCESIFIDSFNSATKKCDRYVKYKEQISVNFNNNLLFCFFKFHSIDNLYPYFIIYDIINDFKQKNDIVFKKKKLLISYLSQQEIIMMQHLMVEDFVKLSSFDKNDLLELFNKIIEVLGGFYK